MYFRTDLNKTLSIYVYMYVCSAYITYGILSDPFFVYVCMHLFNYYVCMYLCMYVELGAEDSADDEDEQEVVRRILQRV